MAKARQRMTIIRRWDDVPAFANEEEEAAFWDTHELGDELLERMSPQRDPKLPPPRPRTKPIAIRFDESTIRRVRALAHRRGKGYQTLLKEFVTERLYEEEKREGLVGVSSSMREGGVAPPKTPGAGSKRTSTRKKEPPEAPSMEPD